MINKIVKGVGTGVLASAAVAGGVGLITMEVNKNKHTTTVIGMPKPKAKAKAVVTTTLPPPLAKTVLTMPAPAETSVLHVQSYNDFQVGGDVIIDEGTLYEETNQILKFGSIYLVHPLKFNHSVNASITEKTAASGSPATSAADNSKRHKMLLGLLAVIGACCVCIACACVAFQCCKQNRRTRGFDKVQEQDRMYDLEEPTGPTDSQINASPYKDFKGAGYDPGFSTNLGTAQLEPTGSFPAVDLPPLQVPPLLNAPVPVVNTLRPAPSAPTAVYSAPKTVSYSYAAPSAVI